MVLTALKCPNCRGEIQLDDSFRTGYCMYCGTKIINESVSSAFIKIDNSETVANLLRLGKSSLEIGDIDKAMMCADRCLYMDSECPDAWRLKGLAAACCNDCSAEQAE